MGVTFLHSIIDSFWLLGLVGILVAVYVYDLEQSLVEPQALFQPFDAGAPSGQQPGASLVRSGQATTARSAFDLSGSIYVARTAPDREKRVVKLGGTVLSEKAVADGLAWLARHQAENGAWLRDNLGSGPRSCCSREPRCQRSGGEFGVAYTGLSLLAFQGAGHFSFNETEHSDTVRRGLQWLISRQQEDGGLFSSRGRTFMYEHGIATFALCEAVAVAVKSGVSVDPELQAAAQRAVRFLEDNQHADGGWRYTPNERERSDTSVSGWQVLALKAAREADLQTNRSTIERAATFFRDCRGADGRTNYMSSGQLISEATTGVGMLFETFLKVEPDQSFLEAAAKRLARHAQREWSRGPIRAGGPRDYYLWYNCTLGMFQAGDPWWSAWNEIVRERILELQETEGCVQGSWSPQSRTGGEGGRIYTTALAVLTLEVYYRYTRLHNE